jgi:hypothetical protein
MANTREAKQHAHDLIECLDPGKLDAVVRLLEVMIHDDEPVTDEDRRRLREGQAQFARHGKGVPMEEVLAEFGLKPEDFPLHK